MERDLGRLVNGIYRERTSRIADRLVRRNLGLVNPTVVMIGHGTNATPPMPEVDRGAEIGKITWGESDDLALADVIVSATDQDGAQRYVLAEISITVQDRDRVRAQRRAGLLEKATGVTTIPVVIGESEEATEGDSGVAFWQFDPDA